MARAPLDDCGEVDYENTGGGVDVLAEPDPKLDEKLLYLIGRVAVIRELLEEDAPISPTTRKRIKRLQTLIADLPVPEVAEKKVGFGVR